MTTDNNDTSQIDDQKKKKLFYTTSDMLKTINKSIASLDGPPDDPISPRVELQRRMPDGSTRRATDQDLKAADMDSKLKQAAEQVADLSPKGKIEWAERLRKEGNDLYKDGEYREALDVYLTCLVAKSDDADFMRLVFLPVMNNLAQCSLQLGMYKKAQEFCTMALEEVENESSPSSSPQLVAKLYFRLGRAKRLSGAYVEAVHDLDTALGMLHEESVEYRSVQRELQLVKRAEKEEYQNEKRQERAMQKLLGGEANTTRIGGDDDTKPADQQSHTILYEGEGTRRIYSTLTAKRENENEARPPSTRSNQSCLQWYLSLVGRVAEKMLALLGEEKYSSHSNEEQANTDERKKD